MKNTTTFILIATLILIGSSLIYSNDTYTSKPDKETQQAINKLYVK